MEIEQPPRRKKILFLPRWYPSKVDPMPGLFIERHAIAASRFADVAVLALIASPGKAEIEIARDEHLLTLRYYYRQGQTSSRLFNKLINQFRWITALVNGYLIVWREMKGFDLLHVHVLTRLGLFALFIHWCAKTPYVITEHWSRYANGGFKGVFRVAITRRVVRNASGVSTVTSNLWHSMRSYGMTSLNHMVLQNAVDDVYFSPHPVNDTPLNRFVHVSCFTDCSKNISGLLRVLARMNIAGCDFECIMVGEGEDLEKMKAYAIELGLQPPQVQFRGLVTGQALVQVMHSVSFLVLFSNYENMPVVINEALACGIPVVSTDTGGIHEHVREWNGRLVSPGDEDALYSTLLSMLQQPPVFDQERIKKYAENWFGNASIEMQLKRLYGL